MSLLIQAASYVGDYAVGDTVRIKFNATDAAGVLTAITTPTVKCYKDDDGTESTAGITLTEGFDSRTGLYSAIIDTTADGTFYSKGSAFELVLTAGSVGLVSVVGTVVGHFSLANRTLADGKTHGGTTAKMELGSTSATPALKIKNTSGNALLLEQTANTGFALRCSGSVFVQGSPGQDAVLLSGGVWDSEFDQGGAGLALAGGSATASASSYAGAGLFVQSGSPSGGTPGDAVYIQNKTGYSNMGSGNAIGILCATNAGHGIVITATGTDKHGIFVTGGTAGTSDAVKLVAGTGGVSLRAATFTGHAIRKNVALANFNFLMTDSTGHAPVTGKTITATRSIDGAAFGACANAAAEVASGIYKISLAATDLNGDVVTLQFTATGCDTTFVTIVTQP